MRPVLSLGYLRLGVPDLEAWRRFTVDFLGLMEVDGPTEGALHLRMDEHAARFVIVESDEPRLEAAGFETLDAAHLAELAQRVRDAGLEVHELTGEELAARQVREAVRFTDPGGNVIELFQGPVRHHSPIESPVSAFVTGHQGMGHIIVNTPAVEESFEFYRDALGFTDRNTMQLPDSAWMYFLSTNPRQHSLGLAPAEKPGLLHIMVEASSLDDVGRALDRAAEHDIAMMQSLGRHTNDDMVSFYVWSPDLHAVEFGWGARTITEPEPSYQITAGAYWGHAFTPPPAP